MSHLLSHFLYADICFSDSNNVGAGFFPAPFFYLLRKAPRRLVVCLNNTGIWQGVTVL